MPTYVQPSLTLRAYTCPICGTFSQQHHAPVITSGPGLSGTASREGLKITHCSYCGGESLWHVPSGDEPPFIAWPRSSIAPQAHAEMPPDVLAIYQEAGDVGGRSPRAAAALLRLALQMLLLELVPGEDNINRAIGTLVSQGLDSEVQRAMDVVRVIGNNAVHPGQVQLGEDDALVPALFKLLNLIVDQVIARPRRTTELFDLLPAGARDAIDRRDAKSRPAT